MTIDANIIHASDSPENAEKELNRFFKGEGIFEYKRLIDEVL
jgi:nucleoside diphosphate kinase